MIHDLVSHHSIYNYEKKSSLPNKKLNAISEHISKAIMIIPRVFHWMLYFVWVMTHHLGLSIISWNSFFFLKSFLKVHFVNGMLLLLWKNIREYVILREDPKYQWKSTYHYHVKCMEFFSSESSLPSRPLFFKNGFVLE